MKKIVSVLLAGVMLLGMFGCSGKRGEEDNISEATYFVKSFMELLPEMHEELHVGTAGSSIASAIYAAKVAELFTEGMPQADDISSIVGEYAGDALADAEAKALFAEQTASVRDSFASLVADGTAVLKDNGYTPKGDTWDQKTLDPLFAAMAQAAAPGAFAPILEKYYDAVSQKLGHEALQETDLNYMVNDCAGEKGLDGAGYLIKDLDGDGNPELLVGTIAEDDFCGKMILELFFINSYGVAQRVFTSSERDRYYYAGDNNFAHIGSSSAFESFDTTEVYQNGKMNDLTRVTEEYVQAQLLPFSSYQA